MKLHILSDLHLEHHDFKPVVTAADVVVLAGDIGNSAYGLDWARRTFPQQEIVYVAGNHEFYNHDMEEERAYMAAVSEQLGIHFLDNSSAVIDGVRFLGATLWTDFRLFGYGDEWFCLQAGQRGLNDFRVIHCDGKPFTAADSQKLHSESVAWLKHSLDEPFDGKTVVVSHHAPSMQSVASRYRRDLLSACFASDLETLLGRQALWVHAHTHDCFDYEVEGTRVVCNPRGYTRENFGFCPDLVVDV